MSESEAGPRMECGNFEPALPSPVIGSCDYGTWYAVHVARTWISRGLSRFRTITMNYN
jgi:hypothetical protein